MLWTIVLAGATAHAAEPMLTDEASLLPPYACQVEAWVAAFSGVRQYWAQPDCNVNGTLELAVGAGRVVGAMDGRSTQMNLQAKTATDTGGDTLWSYGAEANLARDTDAPRGASAFQTVSARGLASWYPSDDVEFDFNVGAAHTYGHATFLIAGAEVQYNVTDNVQLLAETFRDQPGPMGYQLGVRWTVVPGRLEVYVGYAEHFGAHSAGGTTTVGIRVQTAAFLR